MGQSRCPFEGNCASGFADITRVMFRRGGITMTTACSRGWAARAIVICFAVIALCACATPPEIKALSTAQLGYIDAAIEAVKQQGDALIAACEIIRQNAEAQIAAEERSARDTAANGLAAAMPTAARAAMFIDAIARNAQAGAQSRAKLQAGVDDVKARTQELQAFLGELKNAQSSLDAYLQSEQAGERITQDILGLPRVQALVANASALMNVVKAKSGQLMAAVNGLKAAGGA